MTPQYVDAQGRSRLREIGMGPATMPAPVPSVASTTTRPSIRAANCPCVRLTRSKESSITSPAQVARRVEVLPPVIVQEKQEDGTVVEREAISPPKDYVRTPSGIGIEFDNPKTQQKDLMIFCPYDMYPVRMTYNEQTRKSDGAAWMVNLPREGWTELTFPFVANKNALTLELARLGIHINPMHAETMGKFMSAYLHKLQQEVSREMEYVKMGWREGRQGGFILGDTLYTATGDTEKHCLSPSLLEATSGAVHTAGDRDKWLAAIDIYNREACEAFRTVCYTSLASPLYHFAGVGSTCFNASGAGGIGKTTVLRAAASIWGDWQTYFLRDNTQVAHEAVASGFHHLPVMMDDLTKNAKELSKFVFTFSGGVGRMRGQQDGNLRNNTKRWATLCITTANKDVYADMAQVHRDSNPHLMRLIQIEFPAVGAIRKEEGDFVTATVTENYGWVGCEFAAYIAQHKSEIKERIKRYIAEVQKAVGERSDERFWYAWVACCRVAAEIARDLMLLPGWPVEHDVKWMYEQVHLLRATAATHTTSPAEVISDFFDASVSNTLVLSSKTSSNIDNVVQEPKGELTIRKELDVNVAWVSRRALQAYCHDNGVTMGRAVNEMIKTGVLLKETIQKVLGAHTKFQSGPVKCIEIDLNKLAGKPSLTVVQSTPAPAAVPQAVATI
jgi:uncharacterized protein (DUF927 family)